MSSFGTDSAVLLHMVAPIDPYVLVIFLETGKNPPETLLYSDQLIADLGLCNIQIVSPRPASVHADDPSVDLHASNPDLCCHVRKTIPMLSALRALDCWIKINPLQGWSSDDVSAYMRGTICQIIF